MLLGACDDAAEVSAADYIERAEAHREADDLKAALIELKNALQIEPRNGYARLLLGKTQLELDDLDSAEKELLRARDLGVDMASLAEPLGRTWVEQGRYRRVLDELTVSAGAAPEEAAKLLALQGKAHLRLGELDLAEEKLAAALAADADSASAWIGRARLALERADFEAAARALAKVEEIEPQSPETHALTGDISFAQARYGEAEAAYRAYRDLRPDDWGRHLLLAQTMILGKNLEAAIESLDEILKLVPRDPTANYLRGLAAYQSGDLSAAGTHAHVALTAAPEHPQAMLLAGTVSFKREQNEQAHELLSKALGRNPDNAFARRMLGETLVRLGRSEEAMQVLAPLAKETPEDLSLLALLGSAALDSGDLEAGRRYFEDIARQDPESAAVKAQVGAIRVGLGEVEAGVADLEAAIEQDPALDRAALSLLMTHLREGSYDKAIEIARRFSELHPHRSWGATFEGVALNAKGEREAARAAFLRGLEIEPGAPDASANLAEMEQQDGNLERALALLREAQERNPEHLDTLIRLGALEAQLGQLERAEERFETLVRLAPEDYGPRILLANVYVRSDKPLKALDLTEGLLTQHGNKVPLLDVVARARLAAGRPADAAVVLRSLVELQPDSVPAYLLLATAYAGMGETRKQEQAFEKVLQIEPDNFAAKVALARLWAGQGAAERVRAMLSDLKAAAPDNVDVLEVEARLAMVERRYDEAIALYRKALSRAPSSQLVVSLATAQFRAGDAAGSRATLERRLDESPADTGARAMLAGLLLLDNRLSEARDQYLTVVEAVPGDPRSRNNLAWTLLALGEPQAALVHIDRALELDQRNPLIMDTAASVYLELGRTDQAVRMARRAAELLPDNMEVQYTLAKAMARQGRTEQARAILSEIISRGEPFPKQEEARQLLVELGG